MPTKEQDGDQQHSWTCLCRRWIRAFLGIKIQEPVSPPSRVVSLFEFYQVVLLGLSAQHPPLVQAPFCSKSSSVQTPRPDFPLEVASGGLKGTLGWGVRECETTCCKCNTFLFEHNLLYKIDWWTPYLCASKDAQEIMEDGSGRWFSFSLQPDSVIHLEEKGLPSHLCSLPCVDSPTVLTTLLRELEDAGEVR